MNVIPLSCFRLNPGDTMLAVEPMVDTSVLSLSHGRWIGCVARYQVICDAWREVEGIADFLLRQGYWDLSLLYAWMQSAMTEALSDMEIRCIEFPKFPCLVGANIPVIELEIDIGDVGKVAVHRLVQDRLIKIEIERVYLPQSATRVELRPLP